jgi:RNA polymerase sigma factor (sigma-70 family)
MQKIQPAGGIEPVESVSAERAGQRLGPDDAARKRAAVEMYARNETVLRRAATRYSLCADDAEDAMQRGLEILLRKAPTDDPRELIKWTQTVVKHEALAIRRERERTLAGPTRGEDWVDLLPAASVGPPEAAERSEAVARSREALRALKPQELRALTLLAEGYSYAEIGEITSWSRTKVNRCLAEGRERFRGLLARSEDGRRCAEVRPLISAFCDDEAGPEEVVELREHLRTCGHCRATLRTYRAAPAAAAALAPALPLDRSLLERAQEAASGIAGRFGGGGADPVVQVAPGSGAGGLGVAGLVKVAAVCLGAAGGAAACVAGGLVPSPLNAGAARPEPAPLERQAAAAPEVDYEPAPAPVTELPEPKPTRSPEPVQQQEPEPAPAAAEPAPVVNDPVAEGGATEYAPPPAPEPAPTPEPAPVGSSSGSPAGEFGP